MPKHIRYFLDKKKLDKFKIPYSLVEFDKRTGLTEKYYKVDLLNVTKEQYKLLDDN